MSDIFFTAIQEGDRDKVEHMLRETPNLVLSRDKKDLSPVMAAMYNHKFGIADLLLDRMVALTVFEAAATGKLDHLISNLATRPELVNAYAEDGFQPLGLAAYFGKTEAVKYLVKAGAEVNSASRNPLSVTPLQSAVAGVTSKSPGCCSKQEQAQTSASEAGIPQSIKQSYRVAFAEAGLNNNQKIHRFFCDFLPIQPYMRSRKFDYFKEGVRNEQSSKSIFAFHPAYSDAVSLCHPGFRF